LGSAFDGFNFDHRNMLTMTSSASVAFTSLFLKDDDLFVFLTFENFGCYFCPLHFGSTEFGIVAVLDHEDVFDVYSIACLNAGVLIDGKDVAFLNGELGSLCLDGSFHEGAGRNCILKTLQGFFAKIFRCAFLIRICME
jgi:hypothetical protein